MFVAAEAAAHFAPGPSSKAAILQPCGRHFRPHVDHYEVIFLAGKQIGGQAGKRYIYIYNNN